MYVRPRYNISRSSPSQPTHASRKNILPEGKRQVPNDSFTLLCFVSCHTCRRDCLIGLSSVSCIHTQGARCREGRMPFPPGLHRAHASPYGSLALPPGVVRQPPSGLVNEQAKKAVAVSSGFCNGESCRKWMGRVHHEGQVGHTRSSATVFTTVALGQQPTRTPGSTG